jgi:hypothetical protein
MFAYVIVAILFVGAVFLGPISSEICDGAPAGFKATVIAFLAGYVAFGGWVVSVLF